MNMTNLKVSSLAFTSCSRYYGITSASKYAMLLQSTQYVKLVNCSFHDNLGTALVVNSTDIILAGSDDFIHYHCTESNFCVGGGGIAAVSSNLTFIGNTTFMENNATYGAAGIYLMNCSLTSTQLETSNSSTTRTQVVARTLHNLGISKLTALHWNQQFYWKFSRVWW